MVRKGTGSALFHQSMLKAVILHAALVVCCFLPNKVPHKELLIDIELAGAGDYQDVLGTNQIPVELTEKIVHPKSEIKPALETHPEPKKTDLPDVAVNQASKAELVDDQPTIPDMPKKDIAADVSDHDQVDDVASVVQERAVDDKDIALPEITQKPKSKPEKKSKSKQPKKQKKKKSRNKKALMDVINRADKAQKKQKGRQRLNDIIVTHSVKKTDAFDKMIDSSLQDMKNDVNQRSVSSSDNRTAVGGGMGGVSESDAAFIQAQIYPHWNVSGGVKHADDIVVAIRVQLKENGEVIPSSVKVVDEKRYASDVVFRAVADGAKHAILEASPLKIPRDKIALFRKFTLNFDLKKALGG